MFAEFCLVKNSLAESVLLFIFFLFRSAFTVITVAHHTGINKDKKNKKDMTLNIGFKFYKPTGLSVAGFGPA
jgi:hypothetical protein